MLKTIYEKPYFYGLLVLKIIHTLSSKFVGKKGDSNNLQIIVSLEQLADPIFTN